MLFYVYQLPPLPSSSPLLPPNTKKKKRKEKRPSPVLIYSIDKHGNLH